MKHIGKWIGVVTLGCIFPVAAQVSDDTDKKSKASERSGAGTTDRTGKDDDKTDKPTSGRTGGTTTDRTGGTTTDRDRTGGTTTDRDRTGGTTTDRDRTGGTTTDRDRTGGTTRDRERDTEMESERDRDTGRTTEETREREGGSTRETTTTTTTFTPEYRSKVVKYFETYKSKPHGLPPEWATKIKVKEVPAAWRTTRISPGVVISERERTHLVEAPPELVELLPEPQTEVRYYIAGSNVVAIDRKFRVVDSIQIPSIKLTVSD